MLELELPIRKEIRLRDYDYSGGGAYLITICMRDKKKLLWNTAVGTPSGRPRLSEHGQIVGNAINNIQSVYQNATVDKYVVMPNHIHLILVLSGDGGRPMGVPTVSRIINQLNGHVSKQVGFSLWQARFYEHVIRNEQDYLEIWDYIDNNPFRWNEDEYN